MRNEAAISSAGFFDTLNLSSYYVSRHTTLPLINLASYPILSCHTPTATQQIQLDDVQSHGNEEDLSDCTHQGTGVENCFEG